MAAMFSPDRAAKAPDTVNEAKGAPALKPSFKVPGGPIGADKSQDSLGNPNSPGYEPWGKKKEKENPPEQKTAAPHAAAVEAPVQGSNLIRLSIGWEKLLVAQKKICEKAKGLFTKMEGNGNYANQKRKLKFRKSSGCILDVDSVESAPHPEKAEDPKKNIA
jgi:hypothetical protein